MSQESNPSKTEASIAASQIGRNETIQGVAAMPFVPIEGYTTFAGEYAIAGGDLVFHFSPSREVAAKDPKLGALFWHNTFPGCLDPVAKKIFDADYPRISAQFTHEPDLGVHESWWFKATGFGHLLDPHKKVFEFLDALDSALDKAETATSQ